VGEGWYPGKILKGLAGQPISSEIPSDVIERLKAMEKDEVDAWNEYLELSHRLEKLGRGDLASTLDYIARDEDRHDKELREMLRRLGAWPW